MKTVLFCFLCIQHVKISSEQGRAQFGPNFSNLNRGSAGYNGFMGKSVAQFQEDIRSLKSHFGTKVGSGGNQVQAARRYLAAEIPRFTTKQPLQRQAMIRTQNQRKIPFTVFTKPTTTPSPTPPTPTSPTPSPTTPTPPQSEDRTENSTEEAVRKFEQDYYMNDKVSIYT